MTNYYPVRYSVIICARTILDSNAQRFVTPMNASTHRQMNSNFIFTFSETARPFYPNHRAIPSVFFGTLSSRLTIRGVQEGAS